MKKVIKAAILLASVAIPLAVYSQNNASNNSATASPSSQNMGGGQQMGQIPAGQGQPGMNNMGSNMGDSAQNSQSTQKQPPIFEIMNEIQSIAQETKDPNTKQRLQTLQNKMSEMVKRRQEMQQQNNMQGGGMGQMPNANMNNGQMMMQPGGGQLPPQQGMQGMGSNNNGQMGGGQAQPPSK